MVCPCTQNTLPFRMTDLNRNWCLLWINENKDRKWQNAKYKFYLIFLNKYFHVKIKRWFFDKISIVIKKSIWILVNLYNVSQKIKIIVFYTFYYFCQMFSSNTIRNCNFVFQRLRAEILWLDWKFIWFRKQ